MVLGEVEGQAAPAAADIEYCHARFDNKLAGYDICLVLLGLLQRIPGCLEIGAGIVHLLVEKVTKYTFLGIVVVGDLAVTAGDPVVLAKQFYQR